jgi:hypothetical protein
MDSVLNCSSGGWFMIAAGIASYGLLALGGAALIKYLIFSNRGTALPKREVVGVPSTLPFSGG